MGKRARKTRWRALDIADEHSDSEESNTNSSAVSSRYSHSNSNGYYSKYSYSSQSTPARRRYHQYDGSTKSTRSSSTTSEHKITFNEDEYTRITTPRQDVLFKKGYLNKPKNYHTQTSTGTSTISTGNSTENGTPDHQSADLDYESQFVFPNGFLDQNGIYYVNSYEPYPLMLVNPPTYYQEFSNNKSKRYSTGSLSESMSPNNEEATSQDFNQSGGETSNSGISDYSGGQPMFNMVYPGYYVNDVCTPSDVPNGCHNQSEPVKKLRKRRERKSSKTIPGDSSEFTDENSEDDNSSLHRISIPEDHSQDSKDISEPLPESKNKNSTVKNQPSDVDNAGTVKNETLKTANENDNSNHLPNDVEKTDKIEKTNVDESALTNVDVKKGSVLKPDAEEFIPRAYQSLAPPPHLKIIPPNFMPIPLVPIGDFAGQNFAPHPAFIPPGYPVNFIPQHLGQKMYPAPGFASYPPPIVNEPKVEQKIDPVENRIVKEENERESTATPSHTPVVEENKSQVHSKSIDIATVVSKLEAVKQQENQSNLPTDENNKHKQAVNESRPFKNMPKFSKTQGFKRNYFNKYRNSPIRSEEISPHVTENSSPIVIDNQQQFTSLHVNRRSPARNVYQNVRVTANSGEVKNNHRNSPLRQIDGSQPIRNIENSFNKVGNLNGTLDSQVDRRQNNNAERYQKRNWKLHQNGPPNNFGSPKRLFNPNANQKPNFHNEEKLKDNLNSKNNYSQSLNKQVLPQQTCAQKPQLSSEDNKPEKNFIVENKSDETKPKINNQWISVSSRKKKKNKNIEEIDNDNNDDTIMPSNDASEDQSLELFESYDIHQLVDVIPPKQLIEECSKVEEKRIENILINIAQNEATEGSINQTAISDINIPEVSDIEKTMLVKIDEKHTDESTASSLLTEKITDDLEIMKENCLKSDVINNEENVDQELHGDSFKARKKSKKGTQKPLMKKIIITDIFNDLSLSSVETKTPAKKVVQEIVENEPVVTKPQLSHTTTEDLPTKESTPIEAEQSEKKLKKKKKTKTQKSVSVNNNIVVLPDPSYDAILENNLSNENIDKTNDEITLELDKLIQKGMYNSLQEKIKSINVEPDTDAFFKTIGAVIAPIKDKPSTSMKAPDFNRIFQSTRQFLKPNMVSVEHDNRDIKVDIDIDDKDSKSCSSTADAANPSSGLTLKSDSDAQKIPDVLEAPVEKKNEISEEGQKLYPITQAVKEWMNKTREATPEVEILKSPADIQKEFGGDELDSESDLDEVTIFTSEETLKQDQFEDISPQPDLLEYWEHDLSVVSKDCDLSKDIVYDDSKVCAGGKCCDKCRTDSIKEGDEEIEVYESKYGQNEAFLHLQNEVKNKQEDASGSRHLPYRAACCSLQ